MPCDVLTLPGGGRAILCTRGRTKAPQRCKFCPRTATVLCDGVRARGRTCSAPCCPDHAVHSGRDTDLCPDCVRAAQGRLPLRAQGAQS